jgi:hypothetical protein
VALVVVDSLTVKTSVNPVALVDTLVVAVLVQQLLTTLVVVVDHSSHLQQPTLQHLTANMKAHRHSVSQQSQT